MSVEIHYGPPGFWDKAKQKYHNFQENRQKHQNCVTEKKKAGLTPREASKSCTADEMVKPHGAPQESTFGAEGDDDEMGMPSVAFVGKGHSGMPPQFIEHMRGEEHEDHEEMHKKGARHHK